MSLRSNEGDELVTEKRYHDQMYEEGTRYYQLSDAPKGYLIINERTALTNLILKFVLQVSIIFEIMIRTWNVKRENKPKS